MDVDDETWRILQKERGVVAEAADVEDDAGGVGGGLRGADAGEEAVVGDFDGAAGELGREAGAVEVEEDAVGVGDARGLVEDLLLEVDGDAGIALRDQWRMPVMKGRRPRRGGGGAFIRRVSAEVGVGSESRSLSDEDDEVLDSSAGALDEG